MERFEFVDPTKILFGRGVAAAVGTESARFGRRCLLVSGRTSARNTGLLDKVVAALRGSSIEVIELENILPNPRLSACYDGIELCEKHSIEVIVSLGGGSVLDSAKTIAAGALDDGDVWDFFEKKREIRAYKRKFRKRSTIDPESLQEEEITKQQGRRKVSAGSRIGFQCPFCGNFVTGATEYYSTLTRIITSRLINLAQSSDIKIYCDAVLDSLYQIFGPENRSLRIALDKAGLLQRFEKRTVFRTDIGNE